MPKAHHLRATAIVRRAQAKTFDSDGPTAPRVGFADPGYTARKGRRWAKGEDEFIAGRGIDRHAEILRYTEVL